MSNTEIKDTGAFYVGGTVVMSGIAFFLGALLFQSDLFAAAGILFFISGVGIWIISILVWACSWIAKSPFLSQKNRRTRF